MDTISRRRFLRSLRPLPVNYDVFIHVMDAEGAIISQVDQEPVGGLAPTGLWKPGDIIRDDYRLNVPDMPGPAWSVQVGMYERHTGERLRTDAGELEDSVRLFAVSPNAP